jgi:hypothetical protein
MVGRSRMTLQEAIYRIEELEALLGLGITKPAITGLSDEMWKITCLLAKRDVVTHEMAFIVAYGDRHEADQPTGEKNAIRALVCRLTRLLKIRVKTLRGTGYFCDEKTKKRISEMGGDGPINLHRPNHPITRGGFRRMSSPRGISPTSDRSRVGVGSGPSVVMAAKRVASPKCHRPHSDATRGRAT